MLISSACATTHRRATNAAAVQCSQSVSATTFWQVVQPWLHTPYLYGGNTRNGVDCSGFVAAIYQTLFNKQVPRTTAALWKAVNKIDPKQLQTADLVFFNGLTLNVSHVGMYMYNNQFIHASTSKGVIISSLQEKYYVQHFVGAGTLIR